jgi:DNA-binding CsgD family transcriptional regulator
MTAAAATPWNPPQGPLDELRRLEEAVSRRAADTAQRRQQALAALTARRAAVPGQPFVPVRRDSGLGFAARPIGRLPGGVVVFEPPQPETDSADNAPATRITVDGAVADLPRPRLTDRETQVLRTWLLLDSKPAVATDLSISLGTVNTHLTRIRAKYVDIGRPAPTKAGLVARAVQDGLISLDEL